MHVTLRLLLTLVFVLRYYGFAEAPAPAAAALHRSPESTEPAPPPPPPPPRPPHSPPSDIYDRHIREAAYVYQVHPDLIGAVIQAESAGDPRAVSRKGAQGLMQLMPATAERLGISDPFDPRQNILGGTCYLRFLLDTFRGDITLALAAYNAGEMAVFRHRGIPPYRETREYLWKVARSYQTIVSGGPP
jgi:soluble lytic murein transglycosylase-like protein